MRAAQPFFYLYWFVFRPKTFGAKCLIVCGNNILMIRNTYGQKYWTFPGGHIEKNETPEAAARREVQEEVGIEIGSLRYLGSFTTDRQYKHDTVFCFVGFVATQDFVIDPIEIAQATWFPLDALPESRGMHANQMIEMYKVVKNSLTE